MGCGEEAWSTIAVRGAVNGCDVDGFGEALNLEAGTVRACVCTQGAGAKEGFLLEALSGLICILVASKSLTFLEL